VAIFPREHGLAGFIGTKDNGSDGDNCSYKTCKASSSQIVTTNKPTPNFLQAGCPSDSVKELKGKYHIPWTCSPQAQLGSFSFL